MICTFQTLHFWVQIAIIAGLTIIGVYSMKALVVSLEIRAMTKQDEMKNKSYRDRLLEEELKRRGK